MVARAALGLGEGGNFPSSIKAVAHWFPRRERAFATALFNSGANVGAIVAPAIVPPIAVAWGWRAAFVVMGIVGLAWLVLWLPLLRRSREVEAACRAPSWRSSAPTAPPRRGGRAAPAAGARCWRYRQAWSFIVAKFLTDPVWWFFLIWLPDYFKKTCGARHQEQLGPPGHDLRDHHRAQHRRRLGDRLPRAPRLERHARAQDRRCSSSRCCVLPILFVTRVGPWPAVLLIGIAGAAHQAWSANLFTTTSDMFPKRAVASLVGVGGMAGSIGGFIFPMLRRQPARSPGHLGIRHPFRHLRLGLPGGVRAESPARAPV